MPRGWPQFGGAGGGGGVVTKRTGSGAGNYTTSSTSLVAVDGTNLAVALVTLVSQMIVIWAAGSFANGSASDFTSVVIAKDGTPVAQVIAGGTGASVYFPFSACYSEVGDGSSHTWALYWKVTGGTGNMANDSAYDCPFLNILQIAGT